MDKLAQAVPIWPALGFGFSELGGVTWHPQPGNPAPRLFRAIKSRALVNSMGFNNPGAEAMAATLAQWKQARTLARPPRRPQSGQIQDHAPRPGCGRLRQFLPHSAPPRRFFRRQRQFPQHPNLRQLQDKSALDEILAALQKFKNQSCSAGTASRSELENTSAAKALPMRPILIKVAPDLSFDALDEILELTGPRQIAGIVATNTTIARPETSDEELRRVYAAPGGLSGQPLRARSTEVVRHLYRQTCGTLPIIGVGGIFTAADAWKK